MSETPGEPAQVRLRRAPRYRRFATSGAVLGVALAALVIFLAPDDPNFSTSSVFGYLGATLGLLGALLGAGAAVLIERPAEL